MTKSHADIEAIVERMAKLARLDFSEEERRRSVEKVGAVLEYVEQLGELDTEGIAPTAHALESGADLREDTVVPSTMAEQLRDAAPERDGDFIPVPKVIDGE